MKRILSMVVAFAMVISMVPNVFAAKDNIDMDELLGRLVKLDSIQDVPVRLEEGITGKIYQWTPDTSGTLTFWLDIETEGVTVNYTVTQGDNSVEAVDGTAVLEVVAGTTVNIQMSEVSQAFAQGTLNGILPGCVEMKIAADKTTICRGDTVTFTVTMSALEDCRSAAILLEDTFDEGVFTFVEGRCDVEEAFMKDCGLIDGKLSGVFAFQTATDFFGRIFTLQMQVREDAPFGETTLTAQASARDAAGAVDTKINTLSLSVVCEHGTYNYAKLDGERHERTCTECLMTQIVAHNWDSGMVTKEATCKEAGVKTYTCADCQTTKTEAIAKTEDHVYGAWTNADDDNHKKTCTVCGDEETAAHAWNAGDVTKPATCKEAGVKTYTCVDCRATKTETIAKTEDHTYGAWTKADDDNHKKTCTVCGGEETAAHAWNAGDVTKPATCKEAGVKTYACKVCQTTKTETIVKTEDHTYGAWTKADDDNHKKTCTVCGVEATAAHTWDAGKVTTEPTCKEAGVRTYTCADCNGTKTEAIAKTEDHSYGDWESADADTHKRICTVCGGEETAAHAAASDRLTADENSHWLTCICGAKLQETAHAFDQTKWETDENQHWHVCICGTKSQAVAHSWDAGKVTREPDCKTPGEKTFTCTDCQTVKTESIAVTQNHIYGAWECVDAASHKRICYVCQHQITADHAWDAGKVTREPDCKTPGEKTFTCADCQAVRMESIEVTQNHVYGDWVNADSDTHVHTCAVCQKQETAAHAFDQTKWEADENQHWHGCICGAKQDAAAHSFTEEVLDEAHKVPGSGDKIQYYYDCAHCDTMGTEFFTRGEMDGNEDVNEDDAIYLLQHILMPEFFPVSQGVDYDRNGIVNEDDAIYLLQHILMPDFFPLD